MYDVDLDVDIEQDEGHIRLFPEGGMIMIRLKNNTWRVAGNISSILDYLPRNATHSKIHWESTFRIHHKVAETIYEKNVVLIGDAAHLHSPVGARGMNLGIEDSFIVSKLIQSNSFTDYNLLRRPYLEKTVNRINNMTMGLAGSSRISKMTRRHINKLKFIFPYIMPRTRNFILGLDSLS